MVDPLKARVTVPPPAASVENAVPPKVNVAAAFGRANVTVPRFWQLKKADFPILVTLSGIVTLVSP